MVGVAAADQLGHSQITGVSGGLQELLNIVLHN